MKQEDQKKSDKSEAALREEAILQFWKEKNIFQKSIEKPAPNGDFVFYEGPPTANGRPGVHHLESRAFKDAIPRYKTMRGFRVERQAGWDTHGLPVELEVEKKLGLKSKKEIENFGIEKFNEECKKSVWTYVDEWRNFTDRIGYWVDLDHPYVTYRPEYIESIWNIVSKINDKDLLYKDYKVVPWCPRCGTALSSHELAQGYQDVKDLSVYAKFRLTDFPNGYFLAWTTTPWTLPGNVALAVGADIVYVEAKVGDEVVVLAKDRLSILPEGYEILAEHKGSEMVGMSYEPLYPFLKDSIPDSQKDKIVNAFKVYTADFVTTEDGTGIVHTAVMYGQDDFELGTQYDLPKFHLVDDTGSFTKDAPGFAGRFVKDEDVAVDIIKDLAHRGLLFKKEKYEHSYPHCWRCKTPLIYYARDSWYIRMSHLREELLSQNEEINWEPSYIRDGRFGEWLREVKDWAVSRERYWGTPLPIWQSGDGSERIVVDSIDTLKKRVKKSGNTYFVMRHGKTESNGKDKVSFAHQEKDHLTEEGEKDVLAVARKLKDKGIDLIITSPFVRTKETADLIAKELGLSQDQLVVDSRIQEINPGEFDGKDWILYHEYVSKLGPDWFAQKVAGGESYLDVCRRVGSLMYEVEEKYRDKKVLFVTHGGPAWLFYAVSGDHSNVNQKYAVPNMEDRETQIFVETFKRFQNSEVRELSFTPIPHNENYELDLHRPYIDDVVLVSDSGTELRRIKEVMDVWFDSGAMPFAKNAEDRGTDADGRRESLDEFWKRIQYPADFISEGLDQTRGWFYTLHAIGILLGKGKAYKNVICLGLILDKDGQKMSKSRGNTVNPWDMIDKYGADALRYFMYSVNQPGDSKNFDERTVEDGVRKVFNLLINVQKFYELYAPNRYTTERPKSTHVLDVWVLAYLDRITIRTTEYMESYKVLEATRLLREFIGDLSQWYVRRSRDRFKGENEEDRQAATDTLGFVLETLSRLMAPFAPFFSEYLYQKLRLPNYPESVHLETWPEVAAQSAGGVLAISSMDEVRRLVTLGLEARAKVGIKIRQPLGFLTVKSTTLGGQKEYINVLMDEVNVKDVVFDENLEGEVLLDTTVTPELKEEGNIRELIRTIQEMRKERNLSPSDRISIKLLATKEGRFAVEKWKDEIERVCGVDHINVMEDEPNQGMFSVEF